MLLIWVGINNGQKKMFDKIIYTVLERINHYSTALTSWSWQKLWSNKKDGYGYKRRGRTKKDFKKNG